MAEPSEPDPRTLREAFHEALRLYRDGWSPERPEHPMVNIKGKDYTIREVCERMAGIDDRMDDDVEGDLSSEIDEAGDMNLKSEFAKNRSYATGAQCLLKLMDRRERDYQHIQPRTEI